MRLRAFGRSPEVYLWQVAKPILGLIVPILIPVSFFPSSQPSRNGKSTDTAIISAIHHEGPSVVAAPIALVAMPQPWTASPCPSGAGKKSAIKRCHDSETVRQGTRSGRIYVRQRCGTALLAVASFQERASIHTCRGGWSCIR